MKEPVVDGALMEFIFESQLCPSLGPEQTLRMLGSAWSYNARNRITGTASLERGRVRQVLEGSCNRILALSGRILADPRHTGICVLGLRIVASRSCTTWSMTRCDVRTPACRLVSDASIARLEDARGARAAVRGAGLRAGASPGS